jgi:hypothetical protein
MGDKSMNEKESLQAEFKMAGPEGAKVPETGC